MPLLLAAMTERLEIDYHATTTKIRKWIHRVAALIIADLIIGIAAFDLIILGTIVTASVLHLSLTLGLLGIAATIAQAAVIILTYHALHIPVSLWRKVK